jgi:pimeloyl-ACP methyl ester carboxylesterase
VDPLRVCLDRAIELPPRLIHFREWPGATGPLIHLPDPHAPTSTAIDTLAPELAPRFRVLSLTLPSPHLAEVCAVDLAGFLHAFGFRQVVVLAEGSAAVIAERLAAWCPDAIAGVLVVDAATRPAEVAALAEDRAC